MNAGDITMTISVDMEPNMLLSILRMARSEYLALRKRDLADPKYRDAATACHPHYEAAFQVLENAAIKARNQELRVRYEMELEAHEAAQA